MNNILRTGLNLRKHRTKVGAGKQKTSQDNESRPRFSEIKMLKAAAAKLIVCCRKEKKKSLHYFLCVKGKGEREKESSSFLMLSGMAAEV